MINKSDINLSNIREKYESGESISGLARLLGLSAATTKLRLIEAGAVIRKRKPAVWRDYGWGEYPRSYTKDDVNIDEDCKTAYY